MTDSPFQTKPARTIIVVPELVGQSEDDTVLRPSNVPNLVRISERGSVIKIPRLPDREYVEGLYLGLDDQTEIADGPLTVAALGAGPPIRSTQFHLSLLSLTDSVAHIPAGRPTEAEERAILDQAAKLNTKALTLVKGKGVDHCLVWEAVGDLKTSPPSEVNSQRISGYLPQGDGEPGLRQYIDDSVNLLSEMEINRRRVDEGHPPFNLLWPWGQGTRPQLPNLAIKRGEPAMVQSEDLRVQGLAKMVGYQHTSRHTYRGGINLDLSKLSELAGTTHLLFTIVSAPKQLRSKQMLEELEWFAHELDEKLIAPLLESSADRPRRLLILSPQRNSGGLALFFDSQSHGTGDFPFDERALEEPKLRTDTMRSLIERAIA